MRYCQYYDVLSKKIVSRSFSDCARRVRGLPRVTRNAALLRHLRRQRQHLPNAPPGLLFRFSIRISTAAKICTMSDLPTIRIGYVPGTSAAPSQSFPISKIILPYPS
ncbi:hypothetical protein ACN42_g6454 [Penicillium freii]|uniref:Uncharacterized protein n=1 Tax=Penicillium freii TaxID=48697 RepID=A0A101MHJ2_PENFR|nr:hypothetical protein ACN42_g6454 [Penicillium freii]